MWAAGERRSGIAYFELWDVRMHDEALRELRDAVRVARERSRVDFVIVSVCWGPGNLTLTLTPSAGAQVRLA